MDVSTIALFFFIVSPLVIIIAFRLLIYFLVKLLPAPLGRVLSFNLTNPWLNRQQQQGQEESSNRTVQLQKELLSLVKDDRSKVRKLVEQERRSRPGMSNAWYLEKIIDDLRRGY
ncbi:hypothetical protein [Anabaena sp. PCC 7108]|uniref:hypothetical protein n=1 Tax=Anabaena sp. PCC 7108 TaxID=163908 RepID=UPI00037C5177|nr:hypothetical protein [Anabaena sp. PCC 7108]